MKEQKNARLFLVKNSEKICRMLLSDRHSFTIKKNTYDMSIEDELVRLLLSTQGIEQVIPSEKGLTIIKRVLSTTL